MRSFSVYFSYSEGWTPRNEALFEAVVKQARATRHPWLIACDANMSPKDVEKVCGSKAGRCLWRLQRKCRHADQKGQRVK